MADGKLPARRSRALSQGKQIAIVVLLAGAAGAAIFIAPAVQRSLATQTPEAASPAATVPGTFKPTKEQWAAIVTNPAIQMAFRDEQTTDGKIAIDDDISTPVFSPYSGRVMRLIAKPGDQVERGAPLFAIEANEVVQAQNNLITALSALNKARSVRRLAEITEKRQHDLYDAKAGALKDWQQSQSDLIGAENDYRSAEIGLTAVRNQLHILGKSDADIDNFQATARMNAEALVHAPLAGTVLSRKVGPGQFLSLGATDPVFVIGDLSRVWLVANVREVDVPKMGVGQPVEVHVLAYPDRVFKARITYVAPSVDATTRRLQVRAEVENSDSALKPEMFASFNIVTGNDLAAVGVPKAAVIYEGSNARVWIANADGTITSRQIRVGRTANAMVEVTEGLAPGERVVTRGGLFIDRAASSE
jgi:cobalt-zinc-cadmium efflux system membrane fusion protein